MANLKEFEHLKIHLEAIKSATNNFADENFIGRGGFGRVYKGEITKHKMVAFKRLNRAHGQGDLEFWKEVMMLSVYKHKNIVSLLGYCNDNGERILAYEYAPKGSLDMYLNSSELTWVGRLKICIGAAQGLAYLHSAIGTQQRVLHRDIKSSNILLDDDWNAKLSDFGLSKLGPANQKYTFLFSQAVGTIGYCDPLYAKTGLLTKESDVYSFGVVLFEVLCGRLCIDNNHKPWFLMELVQESYEQNRIHDIIHSNIKDEIKHDSLWVFTKIAHQCLKTNREERPSTIDIVRALEIALRLQNDDLRKEVEAKKNVDANDTNKVDKASIIVVLKLKLHCEECAEKITRSIQKYEGVETVTTNLDSNELTIIGKVDPIRIKERVARKTKREVELLSPKPKNDDEVVNKDDDKPCVENPTNQKPKEKDNVVKEVHENKIFNADGTKKIDEGMITIVLEINLHCEECALKITKTIQLIKGVKKVKAEVVSNTVTIIGEVDTIRVKEQLENKTKTKVKFRSSLRM